jgi:hypothetical protein
VSGLTILFAAERAPGRSLQDAAQQLDRRAERVHTLPMTDRLETLLDEQRTFPPPAAFRAAAHVKDRAPYERAQRDREAYWADWARQLDWIRPWDRVLEWNPPRRGGRLRRLQIGLCGF